MLATPFVFGVFFYSTVIKMITAHLLHTQHKQKEELEYELLVYINPLEDKTKLKGGALNYRVDQSVVKHVGLRDMERGCFPQKN